PYQKHGDKDHRPGFRPVAEKIKTQRRRSDSADDRGQRRNSEDERDDEPRDEQGEPELPRQTECDTGRDGDAFAAGETMEDRKEMSEKDGDSGSCACERRITPCGTEMIRD